MAGAGNELGRTLEAMHERERTDSGRAEADRLAVLAKLPCPNSNATATDRVEIYDLLEFDMLSDDKLCEVAAMDPPKGIGRTNWCEYVLPMLARRLAEHLAERPKPAISAGKAMTRG